MKTTILCGRLGIALRGHKDDGVFVMDSAISGREDNFRGLLAFRVGSGDTLLKQHLTNPKKTATYIFKVV